MFRKKKGDVSKYTREAGSKLSDEPKLAAIHMSRNLNDIGCFKGQERYSINAEGGT